jgi:hypothetical protein
VLQVHGSGYRCRDEEVRASEPTSSWSEARIRFKVVVQLKVQTIPLKMSHLFLVPADDPSDAGSRSDDSLLKLIFAMPITYCVSRDVESCVPNSVMTLEVVMSSVTSVFRKVRKGESAIVYWSMSPCHYSNTWMTLPASAQGTEPIRGSLPAELLKLPRVLEELKTNLETSPSEILQSQQALTTSAIDA